MSERSASLQTAVGAYFASQPRRIPFDDMGHLISEYGDVLGQDIANHREGGAAHEIAQDTARLVVYLMFVGERLGFRVMEEAWIEFGRMQRERAKHRPVEPDPERGFVSQSDDFHAGW